MKIVVGLVEKIRVKGKTSVKTIAKFDTGAKGNSIDIKLAAKAGVGPVVGSTKVTSASIAGFKRRAVVEVVFEIKGKLFRTRANLEDRSHLKYPVLLGRKLIYSNFIVDVERHHGTYKEDDIKPKFRKKYKNIIKELNLR